MPEQVDHGLGLVQPQQAVIDEHAGELVADRLVDQHRGDRRIDAAGQAADHLALADLRADLLDRLLAEGAHGPVAGEAGDLADEIADQLGAVGRVHHFGVEHQAVIFARLVLDHRERRIRRDAGDGKARRHRVMRSPWLIQTGCFSPTPQVESNRRLSALTSTSARPNSRCGRPRPCRRAGPPWSSGRSRCRARERRNRRSAAARAASLPRAPIPARRRGSPPSASSARNAASAFWNGTISE